jgi:predicted RNase H-like HicB family nuclease
MDRMRISLDGVFWKEDGRWYVQFLQTGVVGDGETRAEAMATAVDALMVQVAATVQANNPNNLFARIDPDMSQMFARGHDIVKGEAELFLEEVRKASNDGVVFEEFRAREFDGAPIMTY